VGHGAEEAFPVLADAQNCPSHYELAETLMINEYSHNVFEGEMLDHHGCNLEGEHGEGVFPVEHHAILELLMQ
jgi:hypothetical protein